MYSSSKRRVVTTSASLGLALLSLLLLRRRRPRNNDVQEYCRKVARLFLAKIKLYTAKVNKEEEEKEDRKLTRHKGSCHCAAVAFYVRIVAVDGFCFIRNRPSTHSRIDTSLLYSYRSLLHVHYTYKQVRERSLTLAPASRPNTCTCDKARSSCKPTTWGRPSLRIPFVVNVAFICSTRRVHNVRIFT